MNGMNYSLPLEKLDGVIWQESVFDSHLIKTCHALRKIPLCELTAENIRMLTGQKIGLEYIIPAAIGHLEENPWRSGDYYDGDLLEAVLRIEADFWSEHLDLLHRLAEIMVRTQNWYKEYNEIISPLWTRLSKSLAGKVM